MKNRLSDLNDHLFAQLERLSEEGLTSEQIDTEVKRGAAIVGVADQILRHASLQVQAAKIMSDHGNPAGFGGNHPNARKTHFKKGERRGVAVRLYKPIGTERVAKDGYIERKIHDGLPLQSRWRAVQLIRWEEINGPVPKGHALKCLDGNRQNTSPSNWELVSRSLLPRLNGGRHKTRIAFDEAPSELKPTIMALAKLEQRIHESSET